MNNNERWFHAFTGFNRVSGKPRVLYIEYVLYNPTPGNSPCLVVRAGSWGEERVQLSKIIPWKKIEIDSGVPYSIVAGEFFLNEDGIKGRMEVIPDGFMSWCLTMENRGGGISYMGEVILNDEHYVVRPKDCNGFFDTSFYDPDLPGPWMWLHSGRIRNGSDGKFLKNASFDTDRNHVSLKIKGNTFRFNGLRPFPFLKSEFACRETQRLVIWHVECRRLFSKAVLDISCRKREMLLSRYDNPEGVSQKRRIWTGGNGSGMVKLWRFGKLVADVKAENVCCGLYSEPRKK